MKKGIDVSGIADVLGALNRLGDAGQDAVAAAVHEIAEDTQRAAQDGMKAGAGSAAPGSYPHQQSGKLAKSVGVADVSTSKPKARVGTGEIHGYFLEFGTESMEPRPWLLPSFETAIQNAAEKLRAEFEARSK